MSRILELSDFDDVTRQLRALHGNVVAELLAQVKKKRPKPVPSPSDVVPGAMDDSDLYLLRVEPLDPSARRTAETMDILYHYSSKMRWAQAKGRAPLEVEDVFELDRKRLRTRRLAGASLRLDDVMRRMNDMRSMKYSGPPRPLAGILPRESASLRVLPVSAPSEDRRTLDARPYLVPPRFDEFAPKEWPAAGPQCRAALALGVLEGLLAAELRSIAAVVPVVDVELRGRLIEVLGEQGRAARPFLLDLARRGHTASLAALCGTREGLAAETLTYLGRCDPALSGRSETFLFELVKDVAKGDERVAMRREMIRWIGAPDLRLRMRISRELARHWSEEHEQVAAALRSASERGRVTLLDVALRQDRELTANTALALFDLLRDGDDRIAPAAFDRMRIRSGAPAQLRELGNRTARALPGQTLARTLALLRFAKQLGPHARDLRPWLEAQRPSARGELSQSVEAVLGAIDGKEPVFAAERRPAFRDAWEASSARIDQERGFEGYVSWRKKLFDASGPESALASLGAKHAAWSRFLVRDIRARTPLPVTPEPNLRPKRAPRGMGHAAAKRWLESSRCLPEDPADVHTAFAQRKGPEPRDGERRSLLLAIRKLLPHAASTELWRREINRVPWIAALHQEYRSPFEPCTFVGEVQRLPAWRTPAWLAALIDAEDPLLRAQAAELRRESFGEPALPGFFRTSLAQRHPELLGSRLPGPAVLSLALEFSPDQGALGLGSRLPVPMALRHGDERQRYLAFHLCALACLRAPERAAVPWSKAFATCDEDIALLAGELFERLAQSQAFRAKLGYLQWLDLLKELLEPHRPEIAARLLLGAAAWRGQPSQLRMPDRHFEHAVTRAAALQYLAHCETITGPNRTLLEKWKARSEEAKEVDAELVRELGQLLGRGRR